MWRVWVKAEGGAANAWGRNRHALITSKRKRARVFTEYEVIRIRQLDALTTTLNLRGAHYGDWVETRKGNKKILEITWIGKW